MSGGAHVGLESEIPEGRWRSAHPAGVGVSASVNWRMERSDVGFRLWVAAVAQLNCRVRAVLERSRATTRGPARSPSALQDVNRPRRYLHFAHPRRSVI